MVVKMMRWRPWPPIFSQKFEVKLVLRCIHGLRVRDRRDGGDDTEKARPLSPSAGVVAEVRWKGRPRTPLSPLRRTIRRNRTKEVGVRKGTGEWEGDGFVSVEWNEEFRCVCALTYHKDSAFHPWVIAITVFSSGLNDATRNKNSVLGTATLNLAEYASAAAGKEIEIQIPMSLAGVTTEQPPSLHLALSIVELKNTRDSEITWGTIIPILSSPTSNGSPVVEKDELSSIRAGLSRVKILKELVYASKSKKSCREDESSEGRGSTKSEDAESPYPFDTGSIDNDLDGGECEDDMSDCNIRKSFNYDTLASANLFGRSLYSEMKTNGEYEECVFYSYRRSDVGCLQAETPLSSTNLSSLQTSKRSLLPWKKRKMSFKSPKSKGEPLLKSYGEEGGDDIDFDRRQMSSPEDSPGWQEMDNETAANGLPITEFGDDNFAVGKWEMKEFLSRDGHLKLSTEVFFASIDQRSERAAGESACTVLVAVIADWFQTNPDIMPIKCQFDSLIREGSLEWRNLCENETYRERFPDKHFDLETVLQANIRPLSVVPEKSFIGFFHPEGITNDNSHFEFLHGAMSFDNIWEEISRAGSESSDGSPQLYIMSWNDHFFILKVESDAYYIIDTLGERLYEGCRQAYILKFSKESVIRIIPAEDNAATCEGKGSKVEAVESGKQQEQPNATDDPQGAEADGCHNEEKNCLCRGKESCKEYIKSFLAALPIRELLVDIKKGLMASTPLHQVLQIDFHYTMLSEQTVHSPSSLPVTESVANIPCTELLMQTVSLPPQCQET